MLDGYSTFNVFVALVVQPVDCSFVKTYINRTL